MSFLFGDRYIRARSTVLYMHVSMTTAVCMYICKVITYSKGKHQPGKVANPVRGQLAEHGK